MFWSEPTRGYIDDAYKDRVNGELAEMRLFMMNLIDVVNKNAEMLDHAARRIEQLELQKKPPQTPVERALAEQNEKYRKTVQTRNPDAPTAQQLPRSTNVVPITDGRRRPRP